MSARHVEPREVVALLPRPRSGSPRRAAARDGRRDGGRDRTPRPTAVAPTPMPPATRAPSAPVVVPDDLRSLVDSPQVVPASAAPRRAAGAATPALAPALPVAVPAPRRAAPGPAPASARDVLADALTALSGSTPTPAAPHAARDALSEALTSVAAASDVTLSDDVLRTGVLPEPSASRGRRRRALVALALVGGLVAAGLGGTALLGADEAAPTADTAAAAPVRTERTVLLSVRTADGAVPVSALLAADAATGSASLVLLPGRVLAPVPGVGTVPLSEAAELPDPDAPRTALSDLLGVWVDGGWTLDADALGDLVDAVGGVEVDVTEQVVESLPDGTARLVLEPGRQRLSGSTVGPWLAQDAGTGLDALPRLQQLLDGVLLALPAEPAAAADLLAPLLGTDALTALQPEDVVALLTTAAGELRDADLPADALPVLPVETGGEESTWRLDREAGAALVDRALSASAFGDARGDGNRVLVLNGVGTPGLGDGARDRLVANGFAFAGSRNAGSDGGSFGHPTSQVLIRSVAPEAREQGVDVAAALGLPADAVKVSPRGQTVADVIVVLGADYRP